jgi:DNA polymerase-3 subunit delta'
MTVDKLSFGPENTPHLLGHQTQLAAFQERFDKGSLPHALLFTGPKGIGKATTAYHLARWILSRDEGAPPHDPNSWLFRHIAMGIYPDLFVLSHRRYPSATQTLPVEAVRDLIHFFHQKPLRATWRIALIDALDHLHPRGCGALLKILEEPPSQCLLILIAHHPDRVLPTLRSRCHHEPFHPLRSAEMKAVLPHLDGGDFLDPALVDNSFGRPGLLHGLYDTLAPSFLKDFQGVTEQLSQGNMPAFHRFLDQHILKAEGADALAVLDTFLSFFTLWLHRGLQRHGQGLPLSACEASFFQTFSPQALVQGWDGFSRVLRQAHTFHLDRRSTLLVAFGTLLGWDN